MSTPLTLERRTARRLFLSLQGLSDNPNRRMRSDELYALIERMGFVQLDSIITIERAHHLTLFSRNQTYRRRDFDRLLEKDRRLFEHWTHDASVIPIQWFGHWSHRFERMANKQSNSAWFAERIGPGDIVITQDIPLADRCIKNDARALRPNGKALDKASIGMALATRDLMTDLRSAGETTRGPRAFAKQDRSNFLQALETTIQAVKNAG